ncbi:MAG: AraC family transcriptional regulator [Gemmatimonadaceae bacterium]|nr:AraC family transcriptional regulator [Gemmatimonadaceae bacterium]
MPSPLRLDVDDYAPAGRQPAHTHDALHLSVVLRGVVHEEVGAHAVCAGPLDVVAKDPGVRHANAWGTTGARLARLSLPGGCLRDLIDTAATAPAWRWTHDPRVARPFLRLVARQHEGTRAVAPDDADVVDLLAAFTARRSGEPHGTPPAWLRDAMTFLRESTGPALTGRDVAAHAHVHPVYLARCVRRWYGLGLGEAIRARRLRAAVADITTSDTLLAPIAHAHGYADEAHLSRAVRRVTGLPPGRLRRLVGTMV